LELQSLPRLEIDVRIADGETAVIGAIMEHIEQAGVHSGDSACVIPPYSLPNDVIDAIKRQTKAMALDLALKCHRLRVPHDLVE